MSEHEHSAEGDCATDGHCMHQYRVACPLGCGCPGPEPYRECCRCGLTNVG